MSFNSNIIEVKRFFPAHSDGFSSIKSILINLLEDRNVLDASKGYAKSNPEPEKTEKQFVDISAPVKFSDESMNIQNVGQFFCFSLNLLIFKRKILISRVPSQM